MTLREKIEVMQAFERGEEIEYNMLNSDFIDWDIATQPTFNWQAYDYRIKPKPKQEEHKMKTQWIYFGLEEGGYGNRYHITQAMTEEEFLKQYGICVSIVSYFPVSNISMSNVKHKVQFFKNECKEHKPKQVVVIEKWLIRDCLDIETVIEINAEQLDFFLPEANSKKVKLLDTYEVEL